MSDPAYICVYKLVDGRQNVLVSRHIFKGIWTILFDPRWTILDAAMDGSRALPTMANCLLLQLAGWLRFSCLWYWCCRS
jgi:hypothetical protein